MIVRLGELSNILQNTAMATSSVSMKVVWMPFPIQEDTDCFSESQLSHCQNKDQVTIEYASNISSSFYAPLHESYQTLQSQIEFHLNKMD